MIWDGTSFTFCPLQEAYPHTSSHSSLVINFQIVTLDPSESLTVSVCLGCYNIATVWVAQTADIYVPLVAGKPESKVLADSVPHEDPLSGLQTPAFSLCAHMACPWYVCVQGRKERERERYEALSSSPYNPITRGPS